MKIGLLDGFGFEEDFLELFFEVELFLIVDNFIMNNDFSHLGHGQFLEVFIEEFKFDRFKLVFEVDDFVFAG